MTDQLARRARLTAESSPAQLAALLQLAAESDGSASAALQLLRSVQTGLASTANDLAQSAGGANPSALRAAGQAAQATALVVTRALLTRTSPQAICVATGALLALQAQASPRAQHHTRLCELHAQTLAALSRLAASMQAATSHEASAVLVCAGIACSCLDGSAWASQAGRCRPQQQEQLDALVAAALIACLRQATANRGADAVAGASAGDIASFRASAMHPAAVQPRALAPYARTVLSAYSARVHNASSIEQLSAQLRPLTTLVNEYTCTAARASHC